MFIFEKGTFGYIIKQDDDTILGEIILTDSTPLFEINSMVSLTLDEIEEIINFMGGLLKR